MKLGGGEMKKRVRCRVVKSVPLSRVERTLRDASISDIKDCEFGGSFSVDMRSSAAGGYRGRRGVAGLSASGIQACHMLDCYV